MFSCGVFPLVISMVSLFYVGCSMPTKTTLPNPPREMISPNPMIPILEDIRFRDTDSHNISLESYDALVTFGEVYSKVKKYYVEDIRANELLPSAIQGMEDWLTKRKKINNKQIVNLKNTNDKETQALKEFVNAFLSLEAESGTKAKPLGHAAIEGMLKALDPQSSFMTKEMYQEIQPETQGNLGGIGVQLANQEGQVVVIAPFEGGPAERIGIESDDKITKINNKDITELTHMEVDRKLRGPLGTGVTVTINRNDESDSLSFYLLREIVKLENVTTKILDHNIGYIHLRHFQDSTPEQLHRLLQSLYAQRVSGLILDLRNNQGGLFVAVVEIADQFLDPGKLIVTIRGRSGREDQYTSMKNLSYPDIPMAVLVNKWTAAGSEILAGALQYLKKVPIIGGPTSGAGTVQTILPIGDEAGLRLTTARFYLASGQALDDNSRIQPDLLVEEQDGKDLPLLKAVEMINASQVDSQDSP